MARLNFSFPVFMTRFRVERSKSIMHYGMSKVLAKKSEIKSFICIEVHLYGSLRSDLELFLCFRLWLQLESTAGFAATSLIIINCCANVEKFFLFSNFGCLSFEAAATMKCQDFGISLWYKGATSVHLI